MDRQAEECLEPARPRAADQRPEGGPSPSTRWAQRVRSLIDKERAHFLKYLVVFRGRHFSHWANNDVLFDGEQSLRADETRLIDLAAFTIGFIQRNGERIPVRATRDLAQNQIRAWKVGNHQCRPASFRGGIVPRKWNDNDFAGYRFDHAASSSGEFQSRARTESLSSAPLNAVLFWESSEAIPLSFCSRTLITNNCMFYHEEHGGDRVIVWSNFVISEISAVKVNQQKIILASRQNQHGSRVRSPEFPLRLRRLQHRYRVKLLRRRANGWYFNTRWNGATVV